MESIKLQNQKYWDAIGIYDSTIHKNQQEINQEVMQFIASGGNILPFYSETDSTLEFRALSNANH